MFVNKKKYIHVKGELDRISGIVDKLKEDNLELNNEVKELQSNILSNENSSTSLSLEVSDDLTTVKPITKINPKTIKALIQERYLPSNKADDEFAISLALMLVCEEAISQIIFSFEEEAKKEEELD